MARALVTRFRALRLFAIMHGELGTALGWRSRDPRRRLIDLRSGLRVARHERIKLIVLEQHIRDAAVAAGLARDFLVWPLPSVRHEQAPATDWVPGNRLRLTFVGSANRRKGFGAIIDLQRQFRTDHDWALVGELSDGFVPADARGFEVPAGRLSRAEFVHELRRADYALMAFGAEYAFTASGSLMDCIAQRKPIIAVRTPLLDLLETRHGRFGHLCTDQSAMAALLADPTRLRDPETYAGFQRALDAIHADRLPQRLATIVARDLR